MSDGLARHLRHVLVDAAEALHAHHDPDLSPCVDCVHLRSQLLQAVRNLDRLPAQPARAPILLPVPTLPFEEAASGD